MRGWPPSFPASLSPPTSRKFPRLPSCRKPSGGLIYPPPDSLAGSHRKGCPQGPLQACEDSQWLGVCVLWSPLVEQGEGAGGRRQGARRTKLGRAGSWVFELGWG